MATRTTATSMSIGTDAEFRAVGVWISDGFAAFGWSLEYQAFATGTNWTDVTTPAANNTARVTEVWAMDDALQATAPCYVKIEYGRSNVNVFGIRFILATGHAGSGSMTNTLIDTGTTYFGPSAANANSMTHYASGDTNRICWWLAASGTSFSNSNSFGLSVERRLDSTGTPVGTGFLFMRMAPSVSAVYGTNATLASAVGPYGATTFTGSTMPVGTSWTAANMTFDSKTSITPLMHCLGPTEIGLAIVGFALAAYTVGATFSCTFFGTSHTFIAVNDSTQLGHNSSIRTAMRYE